VFKNLGTACKVQAYNKVTSPVNSTDIKQPHNHVHHSVQRNQRDALFIHFIMSYVFLDVSSITCSSTGGPTQAAFGMLALTVSLQGIYSVLTGHLQGIYVCCVLSGRSLCDELITHPEKSYRLWRFDVCNQETSCDEEAVACTGLQSQRKKYIYIYTVKPVLSGPCIKRNLS
jgi:hypothetical protein